MTYGGVSKYAGFDVGVSTFLGRDTCVESGSVVGRRELERKKTE